MRAELETVQFAGVYSQRERWRPRQAGNICTCQRRASKKTKGDEGG